MPDLSAYIAFNVKLDFTTGKIVVDDVSNYPVGVENDITGILTITQPDQVTRAGDWDNPDIIYSGGALTDGQVDLRLTSANKPQQGLYTIRYDIDHPGYSPTTLTKQFTLAYTRPTQEVTESFDVFTPVLALTDTTSYSVSGWNISSTTRAWNIQVGTIGVKTGTASSLDLAMSSNYYDATYVGTLIADILYAHPTYTYLTILDRFTYNIDTSANTPPSPETMLTYLNTLKARMEELRNTCDPFEAAKRTYQYAFVLYRHIRDRICKSQFSGLYDYIQEFLNLYYSYVETYVNTNAVIPAYDFGDCAGSGSGESAIKLEFIIGTTEGAPIDGETTFTDERMIGRDVDLYIGRILQLTLDDGSGVTYSKPTISDTLTLTGQVWETGASVVIKIL